MTDPHATDPHATDPHPTEFTVTAHRGTSTLTVRVTGELDYDTSDEFLDTVTDHLARRPALHEVRLDFRDLQWIDSSGLSALLMIHRRAVATDVLLHLDNRPDFLNRMLDITNVLDHLTSATLPPPAR
ncbi:STAS domain-containing protein [Streptomyces sp. NPDC048664]|uniref:STAS domain-containing protein n=1 Tax=Streptomyces sp. NPDC048664 TaxID=3154505 RepID=UPI003419946F